MLEDIFHEALFLILTMITVIITPSLITGLLISIFQAATQINEQTISFLPRLIVTILTIMFVGNWLQIKLTDYFHDIMLAIPEVIY